MAHYVSGGACKSWANNSSRLMHAQRFGAFIPFEAGHLILTLFEKEKNCESVFKLWSIGSCFKMLY